MGGGETSYCNIDFLSEIKNKVLEINKDYKFKTLKGHIDDYILMCYI